MLFFSAEDTDFTLNVTRLNERTEYITEKKNVQNKKD